MNDPKPRTGQQALQCAAVLILCRCFLFFCCDLPYTAAHAKGCTVAFLLTAGLLLPLLPRLSGIRIPQRILPLMRVFSLLWTARLLALLYALLVQLASPRPLFTGALVLVILADLVRLPHSAAARASVLILFLLTAAFLLLPLRTLKTANPVCLYLPGNAGAAFLRCIAGMGEILLMPLLCRKQDTAASCKGIAAWLVTGGLLLPGAVLLGAMQNGRLTGGQKNPFFLMLARTPLSDAVRTDGIWVMLAVCCGIFTMTRFLRTAAAPDGDPRQLSPRTVFRIAVLLAAMTAVFVLVPASGTVFGVISFVCGTLLLWGMGMKVRNAE